jgi:hypothetical protein
MRVGRAHAFVSFFGAALAVAALYACSSKTDTDDSGVPLPPRNFDGGDDGEGGSAPKDASDAKADAVVESGCPDASPTCERIIFVTSATYTGNAIGGFSGADTKCQTVAATSTLPQVKNARFRAWISTKASAVKDRLVHGTAPYMKPKGTLIVASFVDLTDGNLANGIDEDENGAAVNGEAWTGTNIQGNFGPDECDAWTPSGNGGRTGNVGGTGNGWTNGNDRGCGQPHHLYCVQE